MFGRTLLRLVLVVAVAMQLHSAVLATAYNFQEPTDWAVGDAGSTYNYWEATISVPFLASNSPPTGANINPAINAIAGLNVRSPGFVASSGSYYSFTGDFEIFADIYNHGGSAATTSDYQSGYGTRVIFQTAATTNVDLDFSIYSDSVEFLNLDNTPFPETRAPELVGITEIFRQDGVETPFGPAEQQELLSEYYLPEFSGDFRIQFTDAKHSSFQNFRVDTLLVAETSPIPGDFNDDGFVDSDDLAIWQANYGNTMDGMDFLTWQRNYTGTSSAQIAGSSTRSGELQTVPEPTSLLVVIFGIISGLGFRPLRVTK